MDSSSSPQRGIYLAGSISAGREFEANLRLIADAIEACGFEVLSQPVLDPGEDLDCRSLEKCRHIFTRDLNWIAQSAAMIAEISTPSFGVGYEICEALHCAKPVLCLRHESVGDKPLSALLWGNTSAHITVKSYASETMYGIVQDFLATRAG